jgi:hypothetical protein
MESNKLHSLKTLEILKELKEELANTSFQNSREISIELLAEKL